MHKPGHRGLFAQLATPDAAVPDDSCEQRRQSRLAAELIAQRGLPRRLAAARAHRDELLAALTEPAGMWTELPEHQQQLRSLIGDRPEELYAEAVQTAAAIAGTARLSWRLVRGVRLVTPSVRV